MIVFTVIGVLNVAVVLAALLWIGSYEWREKRRIARIVREITRVPDRKRSYRLIRI